MGRSLKVPWSFLPYFYPFILPLFYSHFSLSVFPFFVQILFVCFHFLCVSFIKKKKQHFSLFFFLNQVLLQMIDAGIKEKNIFILDRKKFCLR